MPFVNAWGLSLNPEDIAEMAYAVLLHARSGRTFEEIDDAVKEQLAEYTAKQSPFDREAYGGETRGSDDNPKLGQREAGGRRTPRKVLWGLPVAPMKRPYLVVHDYGMGCLWAYLWAESEDVIHAEFDDLKVVDQLPAWLGEGESELESHDVDGPLPRWLNVLRKAP